MTLPPIDLSAISAVLSSDPTDLMLDYYGNLMSITRTPGESDAQLRNRIKLMLRYPYTLPTPTMHLLILLAKLRFTSARRVVTPLLPAGYQI